MLIDRIAASLAPRTSYAAIAELLEQGEDATLATPGLIRPAARRALSRAQPRPMLVVIAGEEAAERFARQTAAYLLPERVLHFPERSDLPWTDARPTSSRSAPRARAARARQEPAGRRRRLGARAAARGPAARAATSSSRSSLAEGGDARPRGGGRAPRPHGLRARGHSPRSPAQFAVRGGMLDVFPRRRYASRARRAVRRRDRDAQALRALDRADHRRRRAASRSTRAASSCSRARGAEAARAGARARRRSRTASSRTISSSSEQGVYFNGIERYLPLLYKRAGAPTEYLGPATLVVVAEPRSLFDDAARRHDELDGLAASAARARSSTALYLPPAQLDFGERQRLTLLSLLRAGAGVDAELVGAPARGLRRRGALRRRRALAARPAGTAVALAVPDRRARQRIGDTLADAACVSVERDHATDAPRRPDPRGADASTTPAAALAPRGPLAESSTDRRRGARGLRGPRRARGGRQHRRRLPARERASRRGARSTRRSSRSPSRPATTSSTRRTASRSSARSCARRCSASSATTCCSSTRKGDKLYVPVEQLDRVTKYVGPEGHSPRVTRLNTADWSRATGKARKAARKLAFDLVDLYARRATVERLRVRRRTRRGRSRWRRRSRSRRRPTSSPPSPT